MLSVLRWMLLVAAAQGGEAVTSAPVHRLSTWERLAGWQQIFDGVDDSAWEFVPTPPTFTPPALSTAGWLDGGVDAVRRIAWKEEVRDFELELRARRRSDAAGAERIVRAVLLDEHLELWDGSLHMQKVLVNRNSDVQLGRVIVRRLDDKDLRFLLALDTREDVFTDVRIRSGRGAVGRHVEVFDRATLAGWRAIGDAHWSVDNGAIVGEVGGGSQSFLVSEASYGDFVLEISVLNDLPGNSGIQVRSHQNEQGRVFGYQAEIDPSSRGWSGGLYDEGRRGWLQTLEGRSARGAFRPRSWNTYRIECFGPHIRTWVNGFPCVDYIDALDHEGFIGLQVHSGKDTKVRWKYLRLYTHGVGTEVPVELTPGPHSSSWAADLGPDYVLRAEWDGSKLPAGWMLTAGGRVCVLGSSGWSAPGVPELPEKDARVLYVIQAGSRFRIGTDRSSWHEGAIEGSPTYVLLEAMYSTSTPPAGLKLTVRKPPQR